MQTDVQAVQMRLDDLISVAKQIENTEFLLQLRNLEMPDRKVLQKLLEFLTEKIQFNVSERASDFIWMKFIFYH